jgi:hypothetical protein
MAKITSLLVHIWQVVSGHMAKLTSDFRTEASKKGATD